jgi:nitrogen-specific signal transduction histidine kinase
VVVTTILDKLPTILVLAVLVGIFLSLRKHAPSARLRLWTYAWALIFLHFFIEAFETRTGAVEKIIESIDLGALELSGVVFVASLILTVETRRTRRALIAVLGLPAAFHAIAVTFDWHMPWTLAICLALFFFGGAAFALYGPWRPGLFNLSVAVGFTGTGIWAIHDQLHGRPDLGINAILTITFGLCGFLFWRRYPRPSPGVIAVTGGFLCWGAVFPAGALFDHFLPKLQINPELWNVPKFFVAFGMVLSLLEDKSAIIEKAHERDRAENRLLMRLSQITSRLLTGKDPVALCAEIAGAVSDASSFRRVTLFLTGESQSLYLASSYGFSPPEMEQLEKRTTTWTVESLKELCGVGRLLGNNSVRVSLDDAECEVLIPLVSSRGSYMGCFCLSGHESETAIDVSEMTKLEVLASDLAVTIENTRLHHQLARSEKLAALGQLVAGVAHELNNPLTGIIGYAELLGEEVENHKAIQRVTKLGSEARRMKRIVDGLLRFARQNNPAARAADFEPALRDVIQLREYHLRKLGIHVELDIPPVMPPLAIGEDELKQVMLNILNNAIDAVEDSAKRAIHIHAARRGDRVAIQFQDSGPGFTDANRAFDPFYTTKPVGKGTGLGLSICYGIARECGGEIVLANHHPYGAIVTIELPVSVAAAQPAIAGVA